MNVFSVVHLKISIFFLISHILSTKVSPEWRLNLSFGSQKKCPFNTGDRYKDYVSIFLGPNFMSP